MNVHHNEQQARSASRNDLPDRPLQAARLRQEGRHDQALAGLLRHDGGHIAV
jgi:hypothetical protein